MANNLNIKVEGVDKAIADLKATELRKRGRLIGAVALTAIMGEGEMKRTLSQKGTGRTYTHHFWTDSSGNLRRGKKRSKPHTASAPGKPPVVDTGVYRASWHHRFSGLSGEVYTNQDIGPWLEYGTKKMAARPHVGPVSEKLKPIWIANAAKALAD